MVRKRLDQMNAPYTQQKDFVELKVGDKRITDKSTRKLIHKGNVAYRAGNFSLAAKHFAKAWEADYDNLFLLTIISHSLAKLGNRDVAIALIEKAISVHGITEDIIKIIGEMATDMGMFEVAEKIYNQAIQLYPAIEDNYINLTAVIEKQDDG